MVDRYNPEVIPTFDPYGGSAGRGAPVYGDVRAALDVHTDAFGRLDTIAGARNVLDIASHYNFSPERLRLFRNGSRAFPQYNDIAQFSDEADHWLLSPDAGDTMHIESAESGTYVVNYTLQASWAFQLNQALSSGDVLRVGPRTANDGWFMEQRGADHTATQADIIELSGGSEETLLSDVELPRDFTGWYRWQCVYGWYAILNQQWALTDINDEGEVETTIFARSANDGVRGPETGNLNLWIEIEADASTSDLQLEVGSMGMVTVGDPTSLQRDKPQYESITVGGTADTWDPLLAVRIDPNNSNVNSQLTSLDILDYGANDDCELLVVSVDANNTDASEFVEPEYHHGYNSALQSTENVSQVVNSTGTVKDLTASDKPGGYTMAAAVELSGGNRAGTAGTSNQASQEKKGILESDHVVFLARSATVGSDLSFVWDADQNW